jgi:hypothetical protein
VDPVPDALLLRKAGSAGNRTRTFGSVARNTQRCKAGLSAVVAAIVSTTTVRHQYCA